ncbi:MAG: glycosyltransferase [Burkholderiaceae bacterium]
MIATTIAALPLVISVWLAVARGGFWRGREDDAAMHAALPARRAALGRWPDVVVVIPARDEAELVGVTVASLLQQRYEGSLTAIVVDDHSDDGTTAVAIAAATRVGGRERLTVLRAPTLLPDWTGKLSAVAHGVAHAEALPVPPEFLLLTDADIRYGPDAVAALVSSAIDDRLILASLMVRLRCESVAERMLIPAFVFFFQMLYPFAWVAERRRRTAAAAGGCVLVKRTALREAGGIAAIRGALIDDCALAKVLKPHGPIRLSLGEQVQSLRAYPAFDDIRRMVVRSAFAQLRFSLWRLAFVVIAMLVVFVAPVVAAVAGNGWTRVMGFGAWGLMALLFVPTIRRYRVPLWSAFALPGIASAYLAFTVESAIQHVLGRGGMWKGRTNRACSASTAEGP